MNRIYYKRKKMDSAPLCEILALSIKNKDVYDAIIGKCPHIPISCLHNIAKNAEIARVIFTHDERGFRIFFNVSEMLTYHSSCDEKYNGYTFMFYIPELSLYLYFTPGRWGSFMDKMNTVIRQSNDTITLWRIHYSTRMYHNYILCGSPEDVAKAIKLADFSHYVARTDPSGNTYIISQYGSGSYEEAGTAMLGYKDRVYIGILN